MFIFLFLYFHFVQFMFFLLFFFFFNDTATTEIYTLSLHDALPISTRCHPPPRFRRPLRRAFSRSEEHTSELQSHVNLVCRLLLEKKKKKIIHLFLYKKKKKKIKKKKKRIKN